MNPVKTSQGLTDSQRALIERNRQKALQLRRSRLAVNPFATDAAAINPSSNIVHKSLGNLKDSGGGFFLEEDSNVSCTNPTSLEFQAPPICILERPSCIECSDKFSESFLHTKFGHLVCDGCRNKEKHSLITKTEALKEYLLKECDLDKREPVLRYIVKKNPHALRSDMKLYLRCQVEERALEVWGTEEALEDEHEKRGEDKVRRKQKAYDKKVKALRMEVRSSLYRMDRKSHEHVYGEEQHDSDEDIYFKLCLTCNHKLAYEKM